MNNRTTEIINQSNQKKLKLKRNKREVNRRKQQRLKDRYKYLNNLIGGRKILRR